MNDMKFGNLDLTIGSRLGPRRNPRTEMEGPRHLTQVYRKVGAGGIDFFCGEFAGVHFREA